MDSLNRPTQILEFCKEKGVSLSLENDHLKIRGPKQMLTPQLKSALELHRDEIIEQLRCSNTIETERDRNTTFYRDRISETVDKIRHISIMDVPQVKRHQALLFEEEITQAIKNISRKIGACPETTHPDRKNGFAWTTGSGCRS